MTTISIKLISDPTEPDKAYHVASDGYPAGTVAQIPGENRYRYVVPFDLRTGGIWSGDWYETPELAAEGLVKLLTDNGYIQRGEEK